MTTTDRRSPRFDLELNSVYRVRGGEGEFVSGALGDISRHGCCLRTSSAAGDVNDIVELRLVAPEYGSAEIVCEVVWRRNVANGMELGLEFREIDPALKTDIIDAAYRASHAPTATPHVPPQSGAGPSDTET